MAAGIALGQHNGPGFGVALLHDPYEGFNLSRFEVSNDLLGNGDDLRFFQYEFSMGAGRGLGSTLSQRYRATFGCDHCFPVERVDLCFY